MARPGACARAGISTRLSPEQVACLDADHTRLLANRFPTNPVSGLTASSPSSPGDDTRR